jgi:UDP-glucose 4-epimerase
MTELHLVTGGAGCIGSELVGSLLAQGHRVRVVDNLSSGRWEHIEGFDAWPRFCFVGADLRGANYPALLDGVDMVWHLAAKTDIKFLNGYDFAADYDNNLHATWLLLDGMRQAGVKRIAFSSSAAVYGDRSVLDEEVLIPEPVSMYGATKASCEALIRAMAERTGMSAWMFRYCSIVSGKARNAGNMVIPDLIHKLRRDPTRLEILGDGNQTKPSLHVSECVEAMQFIVERAKDPVSVWNIGVADAISVTRQAELVCEAMQVNPEFCYTGGRGGWPGDVPSFVMHVDRLAYLGWRARMTSEQAVKRAIAELLESGE